MIINKKAISKVSKMVLAGQLLFLVGIFSFAYLFIPQLDYPYDGQIIEQKDIEFKFRNANVVLIDDNEDFNSPKEINLDEMNVSKILFESGTYYWKAVGIVESGLREFTVSSNVGLELNEENDSLKNVGDSVLNVSIEDASGLSGLVILDVDIEYGIDMENETIYRGEQYE